MIKSVFLLDAKKFERSNDPSYHRLFMQQSQLSHGFLLSRSRQI